MDRVAPKVSHESLYVMMKQVLIGLLAVTTTSAVDISVSSKGNITGGFHYGLLHEVGDDTYML